MKLTLQLLTLMHRFFQDCHPHKKRYLDSINDQHLLLCRVSSKTSEEVLSWLKEQLVFARLIVSSETGCSGDIFLKVSDWFVYVRCPCFVLAVQVCLVGLKPSRSFVVPRIHLNSSTSPPRQEISNMTTSYESLILVRGKYLILST